MTDTNTIATFTVRTTANAIEVIELTQDAPLGVWSDEVNGWKPSDIAEGSPYVARVVSSHHNADEAKRMREKLQIEAILGWIESPLGLGAK